jgi:myo-inositol-1(or 4)-monophosphatase
MPDPSLQELLKLAERLARDAARISLSGAFPPSVSRKADDSVVTETDHAIQEHTLGAIGAAYPDHAVCAEEKVSHPERHAERTSARYCWVVDPLDGTRNYAAGFPCFSTSIAVLDRGAPVVGLVLEHNLNHLYASVRGSGATLNGRSIRAADPTKTRDLLIGTPSSKEASTVRVMRKWVATRGFVLRNLGSTALHMALVASGALDAAFGQQNKIWDVAAGTLLVIEAGGRVTAPSGSELYPFDLGADPSEDIPFLAGAPILHRRLLESIAGCSSDQTGLAS